MCYEHCHTCKYCDVLYPCALPNKQCPTVNFDTDKNMCDSCRKSLEKFIDDESFEVALHKLRKRNGKN